MIDSHCHINDDLYKSDPEKYIKEAKIHGISAFLVVGFDVNSSKLALEISNKYSECYAAAGIHPSEAAKVSEKDFLEIESMAKNKKAVAIGEIGLDYYWEKDKSIRALQKEVFIKQIEIANKLNLPISIHCRDAIEDCLAILKKHPVKKGGVMHCYAGSLESAKEFIKLGFALGFGGTTTFKNSIKPKEVVANIDKEYILLETDAPYLTPAPYRGQPNHSKYLSLVCDKIAELRQTTTKEIEKITDGNFKRIFLYEKNN